VAFVWCVLTFSICISKSLFFISLNFMPFFISSPTKRVKKPRKARKKWKNSGFDEEEETLSQLMRNKRRSGPSLCLS